MKTIQTLSVMNAQSMTSLEIAQVTGKMHKDVMKAIRNMEPAWLKVNGRNFALVDYKDSKGELRPCYSFTKTECLYVATKFNDEARAKLVIRWQQKTIEAFQRLPEEFTVEDVVRCFNLSSEGAAHSKTRRLIRDHLIEKVNDGRGTTTGLSTFRKTGVLIL